MNPLLHQCFFLLDLTTGKFSNFINRYYGIYKKFVCSDIKRRCPHDGGHDKSQKGAGLLHEALDVGDGTCNAVLEIPDAGEGLAVTFENHAIVQDENLA